jgi:hypothetical protein
MSTLDAHVDDLYKLPLAQFTAARTALARTLEGADATRVKALKKPTLVPWAVNQLYWRDRRTYQKLLDLGRALRAAQVAAIEGRKTSLRDAASAHREALASAARRAVQLAAETGVTAKAEQVAQMLEAVSLMRATPEHPGRFVEVLHPAAFEALEGVTPRDDNARDERDKEKEERARHKSASAARRREIEHDIKKAEHDLSRARDAAAEARRVQTLANAEVASAEESLAAARAQLDELEKER